MESVKPKAFFQLCEDHELSKNPVLTLRHQESRLTCGISEESKWAQKTKVLQKFGQTLDPITMQRT